MSVVSTCIKGYTEGKKIVFFGTGQYYNASCVQSLISYFCDNSPLRHGNEFYGRPINPPEKLLNENKEQTLIIINTEYYQEIANQLLDMGFENIYSNEYNHANIKIPRDILGGKNFLQRKAEVISRYDIEKIKSLFADDLSREVFDTLLEKYKQGNFNFSDINNQVDIYFNDIFRNDLQGDEIYVDAGVFDGKTLVDFIRFTNGKFKKIYAFEPDLTGYTALKKDFSDCRNIIISKSGLSDVDGEAYFDMRGTQSSKIISEDSDKSFLTKIETVKLDSYVKEPVTFIKMDIEGEEQNALFGAEETIIKHKPKLAISVYHRDDDLVKIPLIIHDMVPEYKLFLRHHTQSNVDTVLYAKI